MQTIQDFAGSTDMWSTSAGGHLMKVVNLTGFTVYIYFIQRETGKELSMLPEDNRTIETCWSVLSVLM